MRATALPSDSLLGSYLVVLVWPGEATCGGPKRARPTLCPGLHALAYLVCESRNHLLQWVNASEMTALDTR